MTKAQDPTGLTTTVQSISISMDEYNIIVSAYTLYRDLEYCCTSQTICGTFKFRKTEEWLANSDPYKL